MAGVIAVPSKGCILQYLSTASPGVYTTLAHQGSLNGLNISAKTEDVTQQDSGSFFRDFVTTLLDPGTMALEIYAQPAIQSFKDLVTMFKNRGFNGVAGQPIPFRLVFSDAAFTMWHFNGFIADMKMTQTVDTVIKCALTIKATGAIDFTTQDVPYP